MTDQSSAAAYKRHRTVGYAHGAPGPFAVRKPLVHITPGWRKAQAFCGVWLRQRFAESTAQMTPEPTCKKCLRLAADAVDATVLDTLGGHHERIDNGEPVCCGEPMVHNCGGWYECADAYFALTSDDEEHPEDRVLGDSGLIVDDADLTPYQRERFEHWRTVRVPDEAVWGNA